LEAGVTTASKPSWTSVTRRVAPSFSSKDLRPQRPRPDSGGRWSRECARAVVESFCWGIEPWTRRESRRARKRGLTRWPTRWQGLREFS
jgi:hypothetical protein